jgi:predicted RNase H-like nuclease (RuvC/YqgF family)
VSTLEERVAYLEGQVSELSQGFVEIRDAVRHLEYRMDGRFEAVDQRFESIDRRFEMIDRRFEAIDRRFEGVDRRFEGLERRLDGMDSKMSQQFLWLVGIQVTTLVAIVGALLSRA